MVNNNYFCIYKYTEQPAENFSNFFLKKLIKLLTVKLKFYIINKH